MQINLNDTSKANMLIDIRSEMEFNSYNIPGSVNIPRMNLLNSTEIYLNKYDTYYLICSKGITSLSCANILNKLGYNCYSIIGGIEGIKS